MICSFSKVHKAKGMLLPPIYLFSILFLFEFILVD
nr:MAG TPA: hypothetical protein [Caudoviricetes sp.]